MYTIMVDGYEYSVVYRRYKEELCYAMISSLQSIPALHKAKIWVKKIR